MKQSILNLFLLVILLLLTGAWMKKESLCLSSLVPSFMSAPNGYCYESSLEADEYQVTQLCDSYVDKSKYFRYGYKHGAFRKHITPIADRYEINCSTFSMLILLGINYEHSRYAGGNNEGSNRTEYAQEFMDWFDDGGTIDTGMKFSHDMAKKMYEDGTGFLPDRDFSNIKTGDVLFFNLDPRNDGPAYFMGVDHSAIFAYKFGDKFFIYEVGDDQGPRKVQKTKDSMKKVVLVGRFP